MTAIPFVKMHGLGNDFVIINAADLPVPGPQLPIASMADRHLGIGFDQLLIVTIPPQADEFYCHIFNADGSEAKQCGNGLRCVARYVKDNNLSLHDRFIISTISGSYPVTVGDYREITVDMGIPHCIAPLTEVEVEGEKVPVCIITLGNPHAIICNTAPASPKLAHAIAASSYFTDGANVGFMQTVNAHSANLRTFERGSGETLACGSNACAAAVAGISNGWLKNPVQVNFKHGSCKVDWAGNEARVFLTGPATYVFHGTYCL
jgi:diaminopimelate epimerase